MYDDMSICFDIILMKGPCIPVKIGKQIQTVDRLATTVVLSAHWERGRDSIEGDKFYEVN